MNEKPLAIHEVANLTGVTTRTLRYYDKIDLLKPSIVTETRYRLYTRDDLGRLQEILFFREIGFALKERQLLKSLNFRYASRKKAWYFHADEYHRRSKKEVTMDEIRQKYGSRKVNYHRERKAVAGG